MSSLADVVVVGAGAAGLAAARVLSRAGCSVVFGETGDGRLLNIVGEFLGNRRFRVFAARDMDDREKRSYRKG